MGKKRKSDVSKLDEFDRTMYSTFCSAANSLSQLYTQAMNQQKLAFHAGERHGLEKLYQWILRQHEEGSRVTGADLVAYLQNELEYGGDDSSVSPRFQLPHQQVQFPNMTQQHTILATHAASVSGPGLRSGHLDQSRNSIFSSALSSPVRRSLQPFHLAQGGYCAFTNNGASRHTDASFVHHNKDSNSLSSIDSAMDMHSDSPAHESY